MAAAATTQRQKKIVLECKVCKDAGKDYLGHSVRNKQGKVVCPTLLSVACTYCSEFGHTPKYCPKLKQKDKEYRENKYKQNKNTSHHLKNKNKFDILYNDEENRSDKESEKEINESIITEPITEKNVSWAKIVSTKPSTENVHEVKKLKPRPKLWSQYESDEEYED